MEQNEKKRSEQKEALPALAPIMLISSCVRAGQADGRYRRMDGRARCGGGEWHVMGDSFRAAAPPRVT